MHWLALDIGGANLKLSDGKGYADSCAFALWKEPQRLAQELRTLIAEGPASDHLVVTMTGELADCFDDKAAGVRFILQAMHDAADGRHTRVYLSNGTLVTPQIAQSKPQLAAAANWHALARFAGRYAKKGPALLMDIGSTTSDIVPLVDGVPVTQSQSDTERLLAGELVYTGIERSPVCALIESAPYRGQPCPLAQELFATTLDVYLILGDIAENAADVQTADSRPATKAAARNRLGRMICADGDQFNHRDAVAIAQAASQAQIAKLVVAAEQVIARLPAPPETIVLSGHGEFLARRVLEAMSLSPKLISLAKELGRSASRCATAHALAVLAREAAGA
jgi:probable H4MPT-linked C1 transfer pathway protein